MATADRPEGLAGWTMWALDTFGEFVACALFAVYTAIVADAAWDAPLIAFITGWWLRGAAIQSAIRCWKVLGRRGRGRVMDVTVRAQDQCAPARPAREANARTKARSTRGPVT